MSIAKYIILLDDLRKYHKHWYDESRAMCKWLSKDYHKYKEQWFKEEAKYYKNSADYHKGLYLKYNEVLTG